MEGVPKGFDTFMNLVISDGVEIKRKDEVIIVDEDEFMRLVNIAPKEKGRILAWWCFVAKVCSL